MAHRWRGSLRHERKWLRDDRGGKRVQLPVAAQRRHHSCKDVMIGGKRVICCSSPPAFNLLMIKLTALESHAQAEVLPGEENPQRINTHDTVLAENCRSSDTMRRQPRDPHSSGLLAASA